MELSYTEFKLLEEPKIAELELLKKNNRFIIDIDEMLHQKEVINIIKHVRFIDIPEHSHQFVEMMYVYQGSISQIVNGHSVTLNQGDICILNPGAFHKIKKSSEQDIIINFIIKPKFLEFFLGLFEDGNLICNLIASSMKNTTNQGSHLLFYGNGNTEINLLFNKLIEEFYKKSTHSEAKVKIVLGQVFLEILEHPDKIYFMQENSDDSDSLVQILNIIDTNYSNTTMAEISEETGLPQHKIRKIIKGSTGKSFSHLLQEKRLSKAAELLKTSSISIENIITNVGYENATYFYSLFKTKYNLSLKQYRESKK